MGHGLRVGEADVLHREPGQPPGDVVGVFAAGKHAFEPVERRVGIRAAQGFMQGGDQVVVAVLPLVVDRPPPLHDLEHGGFVEGRPRPGRGPDLFGEVEQIAAIAVGECAQHLPRLRIDRKRPVFAGLGPGQQLFEVLRLQPFQHQHLTAGEQRGVELE